MGLKLKKLSMIFDFETSKKLKMHTRMREICLEIMKDCASDLKNIDSRYPDFPNNPELQKLMAESKALDRTYLIRSIKRWGQFSLEHKEKIDKIKLNG